MGFILDTTKGIKNASAVYSRPTTIGLWLKNTNGTVSGDFSVFQNSTYTENVSIYQESDSKIHFRTETDADSSNISLTCTINVWNFVLARDISDTNHRLSVLDSSTGAITHASDTTSVGLPAIDRLVVGGQDGGGLASDVTGSIAEFWYAAVDAQIGGGQTDETLIRQLAYGGPFSVPHVAQAIHEYRSFRKGGPSSNDDPKEVYAGHGLGPQTWIELGSTSSAPGEHPPLPYWYVKPDQYVANLTV